MSTRRKQRLQRPPKGKKVGPENNRTALIFVGTVLVIMVGLLGLYLVLNF